MVNEILQHCTSAQPRLYRLQRIDRTIDYRGWVPDMVPDGMQVFDFWAVCDEPASQGEVGSQAAFVLTAWVQPGLPISWTDNILFTYDETRAVDYRNTTARLLPCEIVGVLQRVLRGQTFRL